MSKKQKTPRKYKSTMVLTLLYFFLFLPPVHAEQQLSLHHGLNTSNAEYQYLRGKAHHQQGQDSGVFDEAMYWLEKAAKQNHGDALALLARSYFTGEGVTRDSAKALQLIRKAAAAGHTRSKVLISFLEQHGSTLTPFAVNWISGSANDKFERFSKRMTAESAGETES